MFTREYVQECDCEVIQNIKQEGVTALNKGDWVYIKNANPLMEDINFVVDMIMDSGSSFSYQINGYIQFYDRDLIIWLPLSYQLDEEIVKICKEKSNIRYEFSYDFRGYYASVMDGHSLLASCESDNPLIAKIKLLKQLLQHNA